jgi:hypothetical protein
MADFSDDEDRLLIQLSLRQSQILMGKFDWHRIHLHMQHTGKSKEQLRQRLRTLKRRFGQNLSRLPVRLRKTPPLTLPTPLLHSHLAQNAIVKIFGSIDDCIFLQKQESATLDIYMNSYAHNLTSMEHDLRELVVLLVHDV